MRSKKYAETRAARKTRKDLLKRILMVVAVVVGREGN
jgi:hypothetical protein